MIARRPSEKYSIVDLVWSISKRMRAYGLLFIFGFTLVGCALTLHSAHIVVCSVVEARLDALSGPLARELVMGEANTSQVLFQDLKAALGQIGANESLELKVAHGYQSRNLPVPICEAGLARANVFFPIILGSELLGTIEGTVSYFSIYKILILLLILFASLLFGLRFITNRLTSTLKRLLLDPILSLSKDDSISATDSRFPSEVFEIQKNISRLKAVITEKERESFSFYKQRELAKLAKQVAHDIESPLAALQSLVAESQRFLPAEERNQLRASALRIQKITSDLTEEYSDLDNARTSISMPAGVIHSIILEKNVLLKNYPAIQVNQEFDQSAVCSVVSVSDSDLSRVLSNLLNNSIDAVTGLEKGIITVRLERTGSQIRILVMDNGTGIPEETLQKIREVGGSYGKATGRGFGLQHAKELVGVHGGSLSIDSRPNVGTTVTLLLPLASTPRWLSSDIEVAPNDTVVILEDDASVRLLLGRKFANRKVVYLSSPDEFDIVRFPPATSRYFFDYEIGGHSVTGLDLIKTYKLGSRATLATSYYDEPEIQSAIVAAGATLLPKFMIAHVPVVDRIEAIENREFCNSVKDPDLVLVDNDPLVRAVWTSGARRKGLRILVLNKGDDLRLFNVRPDTPVFLDLHLDHESGIDVARRYNESGFQKLLLATARESVPVSDAELPFLSGVVGKGFPENLSDMARK